MLALGAAPLAAAEVTGDFEGSAAVALEFNRGGKISFGSKVSLSVSGDWLCGSGAAGFSRNVTERSTSSVRRFRKSSSLSAVCEVG